MNKFGLFGFEEFNPFLASVLFANNEVTYLMQRSPHLKLKPIMLIKQRPTRMHNLTPVLVPRTQKLQNLN